MNKKVEILKPPSALPTSIECKSLFLGGSIEMGAASNWQIEVENAIADFPVLILNPRRDKWDSTWEQSIHNPVFKEQVDWELDALERASIAVFYFDPATKSPITLMELGLFARSNKAIVCCPEGYWRKGNVDIVCERYGIPQVETLEELIATLRKRLSQ